jgi:predicted CoA-binding protein
MILIKVDIKDILTKYKTIAVVGLSRDPTKCGHIVAEYLKNHGFHIIPVNPTATEVLGERSYGNLLEMPADTQRIVEIIDVFRPSEDVPPVVEQAIEMKEQYDKPYVIWMQLGIVNEQAALKAREAGITVVMNKCMMQEYRKLFPDS